MKNSNRGFTLVEMLVALVVFASAISLLLVGLEQGRQFWFKMSDKMSEQGSLYNRERWLSAMFSEANSAYFPDGNSQASPYFIGETDHINFLTNAPILGGPGSYAAVMLKFDRVEDHYQLQYFEAPNKDPYYGGHDYFSPSQATLLVDDISSYKVRYLAPESEVHLDWAPQDGSNALRATPEWLTQFNSSQESAMPIMVHLQLERKNQQVQDWYFDVNRYSNSADPYAQIGAYK